MVAAVERAAASVVRVTSGCGRSASGIVLEDNLVLTSARALGDGERIAVSQAEERREASLVGRDWSSDVALVRIDGDTLGSPATFTDHQPLKVGQMCLALARPGKSVRASLRIVGVLGGEVPLPGGGKLEAYIETDRALPSGFGGGPLVDLDGNVIGMNTRAAIRGADLAIPHATTKRVSAELKAHGAVVRGYLGVGVQPVRIGAPLRDELGQGRGAMVVALEEQGPAERGGLLLGDILLSLAGEQVRGPQDLAAALFERANQKVEIAIVRSGKRESLDLVTGSRGERGEK
jgi:S1-C subfamily serine protease